MIRYKIKVADLEAMVDAEQSNWRSRARKRTALFRRAGGYQEPLAPFWSEIKAVFMWLQNDKCAYCERQLGAREHGKIEHDIEHFRGKTRLRRGRQTVANTPTPSPQVVVLPMATTCWLTT